MVLFFLTPQKNVSGPEGQAFKGSHEEAQMSSGTQKAVVFTKYFFHYQLLLEKLLTVCLSYNLSVCVCFFLVCCFVRSAWNGSGRTEVSVRVNHIRLFVMKYGWVKSMFTIFLSPCPLDGRYRPSTDSFWYEGTSTVDIDQFFLVCIHIDGRFRPIFCWNRRSTRYRPYFQVGESLSTVDIDRILK